MKAARQVLARFTSKIVPSVKAQTSSATKAAPTRLDAEQLRCVVGGGSPRGSW